MKINPADTLSFQEAIEYLKVSEKAIELAVSECQLRCGIIARNWVGFSFFDPPKEYPDIPPQPPGDWPQVWDFRPTGSDSCGHVKYRQKDIASGYSVYVYPIRTRGFWFLAYGTACDLFFSDDGTIEATYLLPLDGPALQKEFPEGIPWPYFGVTLNHCYQREESNSFQRRKSDLLFLRAELDAFKVQPKASHNELYQSSQLGLYQTFLYQQVGCEKIEPYFLGLVLHTRTKNNVLKLLGGLARAHGVDLGQHAKAAGVLVEMLEKQGINTKFH